jgi:hypothetical protein
MAEQTLKGMMRSSVYASELREMIANDEQH